jgi:hypothetical protein
MALPLRERLIDLVGYLLFLTFAAASALQFDELVPSEGKDFLLLCALGSGISLAAVIGGRYSAAAALSPSRTRRAPLSKAAIDTLRSFNALHVSAKGHG